MPMYRLAEAIEKHAVLYFFIKLSSKSYKKNLTEELHKLL